MTKVCGECGHDVPDDMDFCSYCGSRSTMNVGQTGIPDMVCPSCGTPYGPGDRFCGKCGATLPQITTQMVLSRMRKHGSAAIVVSLIAGFFNVFGLGHLILKEYARGVMFLLMSAIIWYLNDFQLFGGSLIVVLLSVMVYFYQAIDIMKYAYAPEDGK